jgi:hypothetical protein
MVLLFALGSPIAGSCFKDFRMIVIFGKSMAHRTVEIEGAATVLVSFDERILIPSNARLRLGGKKSWRPSELLRIVRIDAIVDRMRCHIWTFNGFVIVQKEFYI